MRHPRVQIADHGLSYVAGLEAGALEAVKPPACVVSVRPVFGNETRPMRAGPLSPSLLSSMYMIRRRMRAISARSSGSMTQAAAWAVPLAAHQGAVIGTSLGDVGRAGGSRARIYRNVRKSRRVQ